MNNARALHSGARSASPWTLFVPSKPRPSSEKTRAGLFTEKGDKRRRRGRAPKEKGEVRRRRGLVSLLSLCLFWKKSAFEKSSAKNFLCSLEREGEGGYKKREGGVVRPFPDLRSPSPPSPFNNQDQASDPPELPLFRATYAAGRLERDRGLFVLFFSSTSTLSKKKGHLDLAKKINPWR